MKKKHSFLLLSIILTIYLVFYLSVSFSIPVDGDGALHAATVKVMAETGTLIDYHPYTITDGLNLLPIFYPKLFYTEMTILYVLIEKATFHAIVPTFGVLISLFIFLITRWLFKRYSIAILS